MKKYYQRVIGTILVVVTVFFSWLNALAVESVDYKTDALSAKTCAANQTVIPKAERDKLFEKEMESILARIEGDTEKGPQYHYRTDYLPYQYKTLSGWAGNQVEGGYRFPTGGGFYHSDSGGPSVSGSVSLSFPSPFNIISVSVGLGNKGSSGQFYNAPNTTDYFKLYVSKVIEVRPYATYRARVGTQNWELYHVGGVPITYSVTAYPRKV